MIEFGVVVLLILGGAVTARCFLKPGEYLTYPCLSAILYVAWVTPQIWALRSDQTLPEASLIWLVLMVLICFLATLFGWYVGVNGRPPQKALRPVSLAAFTTGTAALTAFAISMQLLMGLQPAEARASATWSGPLTIMSFFLNVSNVSLAASLLLVVRKRDWQTISLVIANLTLTLPAAFIYLRRAEMLTLCMTIPMALWFSRRRSIPAPIILAGVAGLTLVVFAMTELREAATARAIQTGEQQGLMSVDVVKSVDFANSTPLNDPENAKEMRNAAEIVSYANATGNLTYGSTAWNNFIFQWVPGQIVGFGLKNSLMIGKSIKESLIDYSAFEISNGSTYTGFGSAFLEFGLLGCVFFFIPAVIFGRLWTLALTGDVFSQTLYMSTMTIALHCVTHFAAYYIVSAPLMFLAVWVLRMASEKPAHRAPAHPTPQSAA
jgi:hypothetical protein